MLVPVRNIMVRGGGVPLTRSLASTATRRTTHPAKAAVEQQSVGEDMQEVKAKNATVPVLMAGGAVFVGYIIYSQVSAGKAAREEKKRAPHDMNTSKPPAGEKPNTGTRG
ncbi:hypothetical protein JCM10908_005060 [Rhodotorula pacifica]|uniref:uncharacterized protein n=1 Tax=Rhodotorula pacifica TaxID=1495444 RepID=UPI003177121F